MKLFTIRIPILCNDEERVRAFQKELERFLEGANRDGAMSASQPAVILDESWRDEVLAASDAESVGMSNRTTVKELLDW